MYIVQLRSILSRTENFGLANYSENVFFFRKMNKVGTKISQKFNDMVTEGKFVESYDAYMY